MTKTQAKGLIAATGLVPIGKFKTAIRKISIEVYPMAETGYAIAIGLSKPWAGVHVVYSNENGEWELVGDNFVLCGVVKGEDKYASADFDLRVEGFQLWLVKQVERFSSRVARQDIAR